MIWAQNLVVFNDKLIVRSNYENPGLSFFTDQEGRFSFYAPYQSSYEFSFIDCAYPVKDTTIMKNNLDKPIEILLEQNRWPITSDSKRNIYLNFIPISERMKPAFMN